MKGLHSLATSIRAALKSRQKLTFATIVGVMFLSVLALPNFTATSPSQNTTDFEMMLQNPVMRDPAEIEDDLVPGTGSLPEFLQGKETTVETKRDEDETKPTSRRKQN